MVYYSEPSRSGANRLLVRRRTDHHDNCIPKFTKSEEDMIPIRITQDYVQKDKIWKESVGRERRCVKKWYVIFMFCGFFYHLALITSEFSCQWTVNQVYAVL